MAPCLPLNAALMCMCVCVERLLIYTDFCFNTNSIMLCHFDQSNTITILNTLYCINMYLVVMCVCIHDYVNMHV